MASHIAARLHRPGPKRMLALDGGGTRGIITLAFLERIEATLQARLGRGDDFVLADYFDMIGGTSVGSILATMLALGWRVERIEKTFTGWAPEIFKRRTSINDRYDARLLSAKITAVVGRETMASDKLKTGLCIVAKRADTNSPWVMTNNPAGRYFYGSGETIGNGEYLLHDVIRASTAAPTLFSPKKIDISAWRESGKRKAKTGYFMDGALSPHNNPSLQMFLLASMKAHNLGGAPVAALKDNRANGRAWELGEEKLQIISIGTGTYAIAVESAWYRARVFEAVGALTSMIHDSEQMAVALLQLMSRPRMSWTIDGEVGDLAAELIGPDPALSFQRYDMPLEAKWLKGETRNSVQPGLQLQAAIAAQRLNIDRRIKRMQELVNVGEMATLSALGKGAAADQVLADHFPAAFDDVWQPTRVGEPV